MSHVKAQSSSFSGTGVIACTVIRYSSLLIEPAGLCRSKHRFVVEIRVTRIHQTSSVAHFEKCDVNVSLCSDSFSILFCGRSESSNKTAPVGDKHGESWVFCISGSQ